MVFYIDSDSLPVRLRSIILKAAVRIGAVAFFVADRELNDVKQFIASDTHRIRTLSGNKQDKSKISMIVVPSGENSADNWIVENAQKDNLCITHDIPLASRLLEKGCIVIDDRGGTYDSDNINALLKNREINTALRECGVFNEQMSKSTSEKAVKSFSDNFDRIISRYS